MKSSTILRRIAGAWRSALLLSLALAAIVPSRAAPIDLADQPLFSTSGVPGNLLLALSVEWPTASTPAYLSTTAYSASTTYVGYFDPAKCYVYTNYSVSAANGYFAPNSAASNHACTSTSSTALWSGNYLNWASTQTLDAFRWALTGGDRVIDTTSLTVIEKTRHSGQGSRNSIYPDKVLSSGVSGATPFNWTLAVSRVFGMGTQLIFSGGQELSCGFATDSNRKTTFTCDASSVGSNSISIATANSTPTSGNSTTVTGTMSGSAGTLSCTVTRSGTNSYSYSCSNALSGSTTCTASATYSSNAAAASCNTASTVTNYTNQSAAAGTATSTAYYQVNARVKVCDSTVGLETNCVAYGSNYKPEGLVQQYAQKLRFSAFGYLNDSNNQRDGGVMRARMKYVGPLSPVPGSASLTNANTEWDSSTGIFNTNPDSADATATTSDSATAGYSVTITNSGVINYLNRFGKIVTGGYKSYDPVSEMYYAGTRYFRNLGNVASYSSLANAGSTGTMQTWLDGFPVIRSWDDPILYSCQKNFILGIGDVNTWDDRNLPGSTITSTDEPSVPTEVSSDSTVNVTTANTMVGTLEGSVPCGTLGTCSSGRNNSFYMVGLAYDAHTKDIRADLDGTQTISTYWLDVMEGQTYSSKNQYWLAAKYGGFTVPAGFSTYSGSNSTSTIPDSAWWTTTDMTPGGGDKRPDNYFLANQADKMVAGLTQAFAKIISENDGQTTTAFSTATAKVSTTNGASYAASYEPKTWSGIVTGSTLSFASNGTPTVTQRWDARALLEASTTTSRKIVTCCNATGAAGLQFTSAALSSAVLNARTNYASFASVPGVASGSQSAANYVSYLRGDRTKEIANGGVYRTRTYLLGDVSNSKANPVGAPSQPYYDATNPGYSAFKRAQTARKTVVYVGANDGMMHAFDGTLPSGSTACSSCGTELFAYVPSFAYNGGDGTATSSGLASNGNPSFSHHFFVDATPLNFDVDFGNTPGASSSTPDWRTIIVGGLGKGGKGYYAIDVTDPSAWTSESAVAGKVLWEFTDSRMGYSYGDASVVKTAKYGWVVVLTSGYNNSDGKGYFFLVNPRTGALLEAIATPDGSTAAPLNMAQHTAFIPDYTDFTTDSLYGSDLLGNIWRADLTAASGTYPAPVKIATLADANGNAQPVTTRPLIEIDPSSKKRYVLIGTGRLLANSDLSTTQRQAFYAIADGTAASGGFFTTATLPSGASFPITRSMLNANTSVLTGIGSAPSNPMGWYFDLGPTDGTVSERINITPVANVGVVAIGINRPIGGACTPGGTSRVLAVSFGTGKTVLVDSNGAALTQSTATSGLITDVGLLNAGGTVRLVVGDTSSKVSNIGLGTSAALSLKRLNWREVPTVD